MTSKTKKISGDASFREFFRIVANKKSSILVIAKKEKYQNLVAYSAINNFLIKKKILAPKLYEHNYKKGFIKIEDFGNLSFHNVLMSEKNKFTIYKKLVNLLLKIQKIKPKKKIKSIINTSYKINYYSIEYLQKESNLFFDWYLTLFLDKKKASKIKKKANKILLKLYKKLYFKNFTFVHRDFHSQNLMSVGSSVGVIDSQDALIGNPAYDLVSLIEDVRIKTTKELKNKIYNYYIKKKFKNNNLLSSKFLRDFEILSVQRSLKIIGIFARLFRRDKKNIYLKLIPYTWSILDERMNSEIFNELKKLLEENINRKFKKRVLNK